MSAFLVSALLLIAAAAPSTPLLLREQAWTAPSTTLARDLTHAPGECLAVRSPEIEIGRALFRSPALLGGPAARAGLSCNACHANGRVNAHFLLPELTNRAGAADVTSEWSSKVRGDGSSNPVDIPDLAGVGQRQTFGRVREPSLENFVRGVIADEFQGVAPPAQAFASLIAYLRALDPSACPVGETALTLTDAADDVRRVIDAAQTADAATASLLLLAGQDAMGRIVERMPARRFAADRARLEALSRELGALRGARGTAETLSAWRARFSAAVALIARRERQSYFNEAALREALQDQQPSSP